MSGPLSDAHKAKLRAAKLGKAKSPEHKAAISAGLRRWNDNASPSEKRNGWRRLLTDAEAQEYRDLRWRHRLSEEEALKAIGRPDLLTLGEASVAEQAALAPIKVPKVPRAKLQVQPRMTASERTFRRHLVAQRRPMTL